MKKLFTFLLVLFTVTLLGGVSNASSLPPANSGTLSVAAGSQLQYQGNVSLDASWPGHLKNPRVGIACYEDVNNDSVINTTWFWNEDGVYGEAGSPSTTFTLGGAGSLWVYNYPNTPAECVAKLWYIPNKNGTAEWNGSGQQGNFVYLAETTFHAAA